MAQGKREEFCSIDMRPGLSACEAHADSLQPALISVCYLLHHCALFEPPTFLYTSLLSAMMVTLSLNGSLGHGSALLPVR